MPQDASRLAELEGELVKLRGRLAGLSGPYRKKLPNTRQNLTHKFSIQGHEDYFTIGFYPDNRHPPSCSSRCRRRGRRSRACWARSAP